MSKSKRESLEEIVSQKFNLVHQYTSFVFELLNDQILSHDDALDHLHTMFQFAETRLVNNAAVLIDETPSTEGK
jgi:hypothetical protein